MLGTVLREPADGSLRMWYMRYPDRILHAISDDGIRWSRPDLGLVPLPDLVHDSSGAIPGCTADACEPIRGDAVRLQPRWRDRATLPADRPLRLRCHLQNAHLFSYATAPSPKES